MLYSLSYFLFLCSFAFVSCNKVIRRHRDTLWSSVLSESPTTIPLNYVPPRPGFVTQIHNLHSSVRNVKYRPTANQDLLNFHNSQYFGELRLGTPGKPFVVVGALHYGSPAHSAIKADVYTIHVSTGVKGKNKEYIQYGTGSCVLDLGLDTAQIGPLSVKNQTFGTARLESTHPFVDLPFDGLVGLGFPEKGSALTEAPLIDNMKRQGILKRNIFSFYMSKDVEAPGAISFGSIDPRYIYSSEEPSWFPVVSTDYWEISITDFKVNGKSLNFCPKHDKHYTKCRGAVDTGSSLITIPSKFLGKLMEKIDIAEDCSNIHALPTVTVVLRDVNGKNVDFHLESQDITITENDLHGNRHCAPAFMPMDIPTRQDTTLFVLGNNFIRKYYSIFDRDNMVVGFMRAKHDGVATPLKSVR